MMARLRGDDDVDGANVRAWRIAVGWSQKQLAKKARISAATMSNVENHDKCETRTLGNIANVLLMARARIPWLRKSTRVRPEDNQGVELIKKIIELQENAQITNMAMSMAGAALLVASWWKRDQPMVALVLAICGLLLSGIAMLVLRGIRIASNSKPLKRHLMRLRRLRVASKLFSCLVLTGATAMAGVEGVAVVKHLTAPPFQPVPPVVQGTPPGQPEPLPTWPADRAAAQRVLDIGGNIRIRMATKIEQQLIPKQVLPEQPFQLIHVVLDGNRNVKNDDMAIFKGC
jgi:DNA-binding XRE family transcriptional regulator